VDKHLKQQIKQDDLITGVEQAAGFVRSHQHEVKVTVAAVVVAALAVGGFTMYRKGRESEAARALDAALETFHAPVAQAGAPADAAVKFATDAERLKKAVGEFDGVGRRYGSMAAGRRARYYAAICRAQLGESAEAEKSLTELAAGDRSAIESGLARLALADLFRHTGRFDQAIASYQQLADEQDASVPRDHALMALSGTLEDAKRLPEAGAAYRRVADEFPQSPYAGEARQRADFLQGTSAPQG
jgi:tetratricopeptide (TPR) repeat protein